MRSLMFWKQYESTEVDRKAWMHMSSEMYGTSTVKQWLKYKKETSA